MDNNTQHPVAWMAMNRDGYPEKCLPSDPEGFPVYRSPPAPVAVDAEFLAAFENILLLFAPYDQSSMQVLIDARACLDKVKELNDGQV